MTEKLAFDYSYNMPDGKAYRPAEVVLFGGFLLLVKAQLAGRASLSDGFRNI